MRRRGEAEAVVVELGVKSIVTESRFQASLGSFKHIEIRNDIMSTEQLLPSLRWMNPWRPAQIVHICKETRDLHRTRRVGR